MIDTFLFGLLPIPGLGPGRHLGRLCRFGSCPKGKVECLVPGCGEVPFRRVIADFAPDEALLGDAVVLYRRGEGFVASTLDLPGPQEEAQD